MSKPILKTTNNNLNKLLETQIDQKKIVKKIKANSFLALIIERYQITDTEIFKYLPQLLTLEQEKHKDNLIWETTIYRNKQGKLSFIKQLRKTNLTNEYKIKQNILFKEYRSYLNDDILSLELLESFHDYPEIYDYLSDFYNDKSNLACLYLTGSIDSKRSYILSLIANNYAIKDKRIAFLDINLLEDKLKRSFNKNTLDIDVLLEDLAALDVVIFDEIGLKQLSMWFIDSFFLPLINQRFQSKGLTYFGSYYNFDELGKQLFKRGASGESLDPKGPLAKKLIYLIDQLSQEKVWINHE
ncbi:ATP-binding protein [Mycoplasmopsis bovirhinis]|uniref:Primosomal protein DnaI n=1 Tax=Mycoplasmopsis bovirhinis TaxID=29553 RepID=A0A449AC80_9BACT|nr:ATP-binding protein [Mycoplasmopsis bovirhinis]VEU62433.1 primosomal protein DnaI [Mycoplasmopsis bovirhinis]